MQCHLTYNLNAEKNKWKIYKRVKVSNYEYCLECVSFFVLCHTCRIVLNLEDLYLRLVKETDPTKLRSCNVGCASTYSMLSHVSLNTNSLQYIFIMERQISFVRVLIINLFLSFTGGSYV